MPFLFDTHTHLQFSAFNQDRDEVIKRTLEANLWVINVGSQKDTSQKAVELTQKYPKGIYASVGIHPIHTNNAYNDPSEVDEIGFRGRGEKFDYGFYKNLAQNKKVVAIGECGLDYYNIKDEQRKNKQKEIFLNHIKLAHELNKPLMIHCRQAFDELISLLNVNSQLLNAKPGIIHFFTGNMTNAKTLLKMGFYFTFGGLITYNREFDEIIRYLPAERILLETDAPYVAPAPYRGQRNEPIYIIETAKKLAELKNNSLEKISKQTAENALKIFNLK